MTKSPTKSAVHRLAGPLAVALLLSAAPAHARPPTLQVSPGYDARLAESRKAWAQYQWSLQHGAARPRLKKPRRVSPR